MPEEIVLDKKTFEALAMDTRVKILKALNERRKTQSELSKELGLAVSTVSQHLDKLEDAGLVRRKKQGKKWVYYELTNKGGGVLSPTAQGVFVFALSVSLLLVVLSSMTLYGTSSTAMYSPMAGEEMHDSNTVSEGDITGSEGSPSYWDSNTIAGSSAGREANETKVDVPNNSEMYIAGYETSSFVNLEAVAVLLMGIALLVGTMAYGIKRKITRRE